MNETLKTIHNLRSIHGNFSSQEIKDEDMETILNACVRAANSSARQNYSVIVVKDKKLMRELCGYVASRVLILCVDYNRIINTAKHLNHSYQMGFIAYNLLHLIRRFYLWGEETRRSIENGQKGMRSLFLRDVAA